MKYETVLPEDFDGVFRFTNWSDEDFIGVWNSVAYKFPANSTSPMVMPYSPLEIQHIRKKFAKDLAEKVYFKSSEYEKIRLVEGPRDGMTMQPRLNSIHQATSYSLGNLAPYIQKALEPLAIAKAEAHAISKPKIEESLSRDSKTGQLNTEAMDDRTSLRAKALSA